MNQPDAAEVEKSSVDTEAIAATLSIAKKTGAVNIWLAAYQRDVDTLLAALATAEERAELAERRNILNPGATEYVARTEQVIEAALAESRGEVERLRKTLAFIADCTPATTAKIAAAALLEAPHEST